MKIVMKFCFLFILIVGVYADDQDQQLTDAISQLPKDIQGQVNPDKVKEIQNNVLKSFKEKCEKYGGPDAFPNAENAFKNLSTCFTSLVDQEVLKQEIEDAKPNGQVDEVFKKYCAKTPMFKGCVNSLMDATKPCLSEEERKNLKTVHNITEQLAEFVCFKQGDRIALFIAEGGPECFESKRDDIQICLNQTIGENQKFDTNNITLDNMPKLVFGKEECDKMTSLQNCVVNVLEQCAQPTSANIVESLFNFVRKATPCKDMVQVSLNTGRVTIVDSSRPGAAPGLGATLATLAAASIVVMLV